MPKHRWFIGYAVATESMPLLVDGRDDLGNIIDMTLGIHPPGYGKPYQLDWWGDEAPICCILTEHHGTDFYPPNASLQVQRTAKGLPGVMVHRYMVHETSSIQINGMPTRRL